MCSGCCVDRVEKASAIFWTDKRVKHCTTTNNDTDGGREPQGYPIFERISNQDHTSNCEETVLKKLHDDGLLREYISKEARRVARERHDPKRILSETIAMYKKVINRSRKYDL